MFSNLRRHSALREQRPTPETTRLAELAYAEPEIEINPLNAVFRVKFPYGEAQAAPAARGTKGVHPANAIFLHALKLSERRSDNVDEDTQAIKNLVHAVIYFALIGDEQKGMDRQPHVNSLISIEPDEEMIDSLIVALGEDNVTVRMSRYEAYGHGQAQSLKDLNQQYSDIGSASLAPHEVVGHF